MIYNQIMDFLGFLTVNFFIFLGPLYIKLGQLLSYNYPFFYQLHNLQNNCPGLKDEEIKYYLNKYSYLNIFPRHIAAGSISVVYTGLYKDKEIAIKVKRPNIERKIKNDENLLKKY